MIENFRRIVLAAFALHCISLFVLPKLDFLFSSATLELMRYGGQGALIPIDATLTFVLYLVPLPALMGLYWLRNWGRNLLVGYFGFLIVWSLFLGASVSGPPETSIALATALLDGAALGLSFLSPLSAVFGETASRRK